MPNRLLPFPRDYTDVFENNHGDALPPHYDYPIELQRGAKIPFSCIYAMSEPELAVLRSYLQENLAKGFIGPSISPARAPALSSDLKCVCGLLVP